MKVVINGCYGGFGLSLEAEALYLKKKGKECFHYTVDYRDIHTQEYTRVHDLKSTRAIFTHASLIDHGESFTDGGLDHKIVTGDSSFYSFDLKRDDPDLVAVVEELGTGRASGDCAKLQVVEIPDDVDWHISEYDGYEHIAEKHRTWR